MADNDSKIRRGETNPEGPNLPAPEAGRRKIPGVNFDEMNFEQRRGPYNGGNRTPTERTYDKDRDDVLRTGHPRSDR